MHINDPRFEGFALVREMLETPEVIRWFDGSAPAKLASRIRQAGRLLLTGEGSSRIFPARNAMTVARRLGLDFCLHTEGATQALEYDLAGWAVLGASNSGRTRELIRLFEHLGAKGHTGRYGLTAHEGSKLAEACDECFVLGCGAENAVAATKSVVEQALFEQVLVGQLAGLPTPDLERLAEAAGQVLAMELNPGLVECVAEAPMIFVAGRNDGVAEELTLKANEITRKKSDFLEGTYAVHGIEEVMNADEVVIVIDPFPGEIEKYQKALIEGVGMKVIAIASAESSLSTIRIPSLPGFDPFLQLLAGWNLLAHVGVAAGIDLDRPVRARKVGNEYM